MILPKTIAVLDDYIENSSCNKLFDQVVVRTRPLLVSWCWKVVFAIGVTSIALFDSTQIPLSIHVAMMERSFRSTHKITMLILIHFHRTVTLQGGVAGIKLPVPLCACAVPVFAALVQVDNYVDYIRHQGDFYLGFVGERRSEPQCG